VEGVLVIHELSKGNTRSLLGSFTLSIRLSLFSVSHNFNLSDEFLGRRQLPVLFAFRLREVSIEVVLEDFE
jgi:hypothetical protein